MEYRPQQPPNQPAALPAFLRAELRRLQVALGAVSTGGGGSSIADTDALPEGSTNLYFTAARVRSTVLTGLSTAAGTVVNATHTVLQAFGFLQKQVSDNLTTLTTHTSDTANPHAVTKAQVSLGSVDNVQQLPMSYLDTDGTLAANSDTKVASQKAVKTYLAGTLLAANNLSDLASASTARSNLGLGTLATQSGTFSGTSSGTNTGDQTSVSGNAGTATALQTSRNIDGQAFNGTADITVIAPGTHAASAKTALADADELPLADSATSFTLKKVTVATLRTDILEVQVFS